MREKGGQMNLLPSKYTHGVKCDKCDIVKKCVCIQSITESRFTGSGQVGYITNPSEFVCFGCIKKIFGKEGK